MSKIKNENYYIIHGWMLNELNLKGTQLQVYSIIFGFSQDGESEFTGSLNYLCDWLGVSKPTAIKALQELVERGLIIKNQLVINGVTFNKYKVNQATLDAVFNRSKETLPPSKETLQEGSKEILLGGSKETLHNKEVSNKELNKELNKEYNTSETQKKSATEKPETEKDVLYEGKLYHTNIEKCNLVKDMFNETCLSLPKVLKVNEARKKSILARLRDYSIEDVKKLFESAERSDFLSGRKTDFKASFDWLLNEKNALKVLEGNYENKKGGNRNGESTRHTEDPFADAHWNRVL